MENNKSASQESIGDDAQFRDLLYASYNEKFGCEAQAKLIAYIDNFRAPAAQAANVAPDELRNKILEEVGYSFNPKSEYTITEGMARKRVLQMRTKVAPVPQQEGSEAGNG